MILSEVVQDYDTWRFKLAYKCHYCEKRLLSSKYEFCPYCGVKLSRDGIVGDVFTPKPEVVCGILALAITNGAFKQSGMKFIMLGAATFKANGCELGEWSRDLYKKNLNNEKGQGNEG